MQASAAVLRRAAIVSASGLVLYTSLEGYTLNWIVYFQTKSNSILKISIIGKWYQYLCIFSLPVSKQRVREMTMNQCARTHTSSGLTIGQAFYFALKYKITESHTCNLNGHYSELILKII